MKINVNDFLDKIKNFESFNDVKTQIEWTDDHCLDNDYNLDFSLDFKYGNLELYNNYYHIFFIMNENKEIVYVDTLGFQCANYFIFDNVLCLCNIDYVVHVNLKDYSSHKLSLR